MGDKDSETSTLDGAWLAFGLYAATAAGALTAFVSLLFNASVEAACMRGGLAWLVSRVIVHAVYWTVLRTGPRRDTSEGSRPEGEQGDQAA